MLLTSEATKKNIRRSLHVVQQLKALRRRLRRAGPGGSQLAGDTTRASARTTGADRKFNASAHM